MKKLLLLLALVFFGNSYADHTPANVAAERIISDSLQSLNKLHTTQQKVDINIVKALINDKFVPLVDARFSASQTLSQHWQLLTDTQKQHLADYIINSLINDYAVFLLNYSNLQKVKLTVNPQIKQKDNLAIVQISFDNEEESADIIIKMIHNDIWQVYDIMISGVSLVKTYEQQFNSYIRRKGFEAFSKKFLQ